MGSEAVSIHRAAGAHTPTARVVDVNPVKAQQWLGRNQRNRPARQKLISLYARDMAAGRWQLTGEAVKFDRDGNLLDGQHRLHAVVASGATVPMLVVWGVAAGAQEVMDSGAKRTAADAFALTGHTNTHMLAAAARLCMEWEGGKLRHKSDTTTSRGHYTTSEVLAFVEANPDLHEAVAAASNMAKRVDLMPSVMAAAWWRFSRINPDDCVAFFSALSNNVTDGIGDPRHTLLNRLAMARRNKEPVFSRPQLFMVCRAWNAWRSGERLHLLKTNTTFPEPI